ncbi:MAG: PIG-L family deacetylase [Bacteroidota bacterium]
MRLLSTFIVLLLTLAIHAQAPKKWTSTDIYEGIEKLNFLGTALYIAAHPDDENTRLIAYLANELKANTAYLSLTRGDGGQNLIGSEIRELLGVIRTQELLAARRTDGGQQFFSRANDFGYSKHPDETLAIWNKDEVLSDVVWVIRNFQPDIIVNRFDHRTPGRTHGHHTSSAMLSVEAFDLTGDPEVYPEQLKYVDTWQPKRVFFNTSWWFYGSREKFTEADKSNMMSVDAGVYYPLRGKSNTEIASASRSMHKSQGFGSTGTRGTQSEYLELIKGDMPADREDLFGGVNTTWTRVNNGAAIGELLKTVQENYDFANPSKSIPNLLLAQKMIASLEDSYWKRVKSKEIEAIITACAGLYLEAVADDPSATPDSEIEIAIEVIKRAETKVVLKSYSMLPMDLDTMTNLTMDNNQKYQFYKNIKLPKDIDYTNSYWLNEKAELGMYTVKDQLLIGKPQKERAMRVRFEIEVEGLPLTIEKEVVYKRTDPVDGEVYRPFEITPPVSTSLDNKVYVFADQQAQTVEVLVKAGKSDVQGFVQLCHPEGWTVSPDSVAFDLKLKGEEFKTTFQLTPPAEQSESAIVPMVTLGEESYTRSAVVMEYDHIPTQTVLMDASAKVVKIDLKKTGERIGYLMGAGDEIPNSLEQIGYQVDMLEDKDMTVANLKQYDAVILGVRAYNTVDRLKFYQPKLMEYVEQGGTMIVQYNTTRRKSVPNEKLGPYPLKLSRDRVSMEDAEIRMLEPDHPVLNFPNKITDKDFDNWVQERGLYFPNEWDEKYTPILSSNDKGEPARDGGLLVAKYGEGYYIYSGYSWFRELPAGVPGAYRLFANLISIGAYEASISEPVEVEEKKGKKKKKKRKKEMKK